MTHWAGRVLMAGAIAVVLGACSRELPTAPAGVGVDACAGVGLDAYLHGDAADPRVAWLVQPDGTRTNVRFPAGHRAVFAPTLQILDPGGRVVMAEGDYVFGACVGGGEPVVAPEESLTLDCGPMPADICRAIAPSVASNLPGRGIGGVAALRFTSADGDYVVTLDDGTTTEGHVAPGF